MEVGGIVRYRPGTKVKNLTAEADGVVTLHAVWERDGSEIENEAHAYCIIDLSGGTEATSYPVTYLDVEPEGGFDTEEYKTTKLVLKRLSAGSYIMDDDQTDESHRVTLTQPFLMGLFEVTQKQWALVMGDNPSTQGIGDSYPVHCVSYDRECERMVFRLVWRIGVWA